MDAQQKTETDIDMYLGVYKYIYIHVYMLYMSNTVFILFFWTENWFGLDCQPLFPAEECQHFLHGTYWQHLNIQLFWIQEGSPRGVVSLEKSHPFCGSFPDVSSWVVSVILCFGEIVNLVNKYLEITTLIAPWLHFHILNFLGFAFG